MSGKYTSILMQETNSYVDRFPQFVDAITFQKEDLFWTEKEIKVEKDEQDLKHNILHSQVHALMFNQRLFTKYEDVIGNDYWIGVVHKKYKCQEIRRLAICFADVENNIHFPFYRRVNEVLGTHNDEFYDAFETDPILVERVKFMQELVASKDTLASMGGFAFMEGAVLFTAFAMIKSLGVKGQSFMPNLISGINMSILDENFHMQTACEIFRTQLELENRTEEDIRKLKEDIFKHAQNVLEHEYIIINAMLAEGDIPFASKKELQAFARHRVNVVLTTLGFPELATFDETDDTISEWFYEFMGGYTSNDNFYSRGRNYKKEFSAVDYDIISNGAVEEVLAQIPDEYLDQMGIDLNRKFEKTLEEELEAQRPKRKKHNNAEDALYVPDYSRERKEMQARGEAPEWMATAGWQLFKKKYLNGDAKTPRDQYMRIAECLAQYAPKSYPSWWNEIDYWKGKTWKDAFFQIMWDGFLSPSTPVLSNTGTDFGMSVSCSGAVTEDSVAGFYDARKINALLSKEGFGTTIDLDRVRGRGKPMKGGIANGALPVARMFRQDALDISQGSQRRGATAWYYNVEGLDFDELLHFLEYDTDGNNGGWKITNELINRVLIGDTLAIERMNKILAVRHHVGLGYELFIDKVNARRPKMYKDRGMMVTTSNLCTEITLFSDPKHTFTCVLSSENLVRFDDRPKNLAFVGTVFLDCVAEDFIQKGSKIEGLETAVEFTKKGRALGYGTMGFASYLMRNNIEYGSMESFWKNKKIYSTIEAETKAASRWLAKELGEPEWCEGYGVRNTHLMAIAPTKSTGLLMGGDSEGINVPSAFVFAQDTPAGTVFRIDPSFLLLLKRKGLYNIDPETKRITPETEALLKRVSDNLGSVQTLTDVLTDKERAVFKTAYEINQYRHIDLCAQRQEHIDQAQSINLFIANMSAQEISKLYMYAALNPNILSLYYHTGIRDSRIGENKNECEACS
ncbi:hypothetical protein [Acinetobacter phage vB_AbaM_CP14]|nr:hypothetical protein [Acinetobacter phage vB_AbaM_CP14]